MGISPNWPDNLLAVSPQYKDRAGNDTSLMLWASLKASIDYSRIGYSRIHKVGVSTSWIGLPGERFETMLFPTRKRDKNAVWANWALRYETEEQARRGHQVVCAILRDRGVAEINRTIIRAEEKKYQQFLRQHQCAE